MQEQRRPGSSEGTPDEKKSTANKAAKELVAKAEKFLVDSDEAMRKAAEPERKSGCGCGF